METTQTKTIQTLAQEILNNMETKKRDNGESFVALKSHDIEWHVDLCREAHDEIMPNDYIYNMIEDSLNYITDSDGETSDEIRDQIIDGQYIEADVYNSDLLNWVSSNLYFSYYVDEAMKEFQPDSLFSALSYGQQRQKEEVFYSVLSSLENRLEELED